MPREQSGPRIAPIEPPYTANLEAALNRLTPAWRDSGPLAVFRLWARHPGLGQAIAPIGRFLLTEGELDPSDRELVVLRICALAGAEYEWGVHADGYSPLSGLSPETVEATVNLTTNDPSWSEREQLLLRMVDEFNTSVDVSDELWESLANVWSDAQLLELILVAGFYRFVSFTVRATRTPLEDWAPRFPASRGAPQ